MKKCNCCGRTYDFNSWHGLPHRGYTELTEIEALEYRDCLCGSTLSRFVGVTAEVWYISTVWWGRAQWCHYDRTVSDAVSAALYSLIDGGADEAVISRGRWEWAGLI
jgi:hypothetical protein